MLREPQKSVLADAIWSKVSESNTDFPSGDIKHVLDGGALLHRVPWPRGSPTYRELCCMYCDYVMRKYGHPDVVFDGYEERTTKDMAHQRRAGGKVGVEVSFTDEMKLSQKKDEFLANTTNKQKFIYMLGEYLQLHGCIVHYAHGDADLLIVTTAVQYAASQTTVLVGDDTDLLVLLCYYVNLAAHELYMYSQAKSNRGSRTWNIKNIRRKLGHETCEGILFVHAIGGCDTTSRLYGIGKGTPLKKFISSKAFCDSSKVFNSPDSAQEEVTCAGEKALVVLYGGKATDNLNSLRYKKFCERTASRDLHIQSQTLPPTAAAARYHSLRVFLQVQQWRGVGGLQPVDWGWKLADGHLIPVMTDLAPAPEHLLHVIHCGCTTDCSSARCTCRKNNLECSPACSQCRGTSCSKSAIVDPESDDDNDDAFNDPVISV